MVDVAALHRLWRVRRSDFVLAAVTAGGVLVVGVLPGIGVGVAVSLLEVLRRAVMPPTAVLGRVAGRTTWRSADNHEGSRTMPGLLVYRFDAPLFFANADVLREQVVRLVDESDPPAREVVLDAEGVVDMDITGPRRSTSSSTNSTSAASGWCWPGCARRCGRHCSRLGLEKRLGSDRFYLHIHDAVADFSRRTRAEQPPAHAQPQPAAPEPEPEPATNETKKPPTPSR